MQKYQDAVVKPNGDILAGASVLVQTYPGAVTATIYSDDGVTEATNPLTTDSIGNFSFYAADGRYQLVVSGTGLTTRTVTDVLLEDPADAMLVLVNGVWLMIGVPTSDPAVANAVWSNGGVVTLSAG